MYICLHKEFNICTFYTLYFSQKEHNYLYKMKFCIFSVSVLVTGIKRNPPKSFSCVCCFSVFNTGR